MSHRLLPPLVLAASLLPGPRAPAQVQWSQLTTTTAPTTSVVGMGYDATTDKVLMVGYGPTGGIEIWGFDGMTWAALPNAGAPGWTSNRHAACYDTDRRRMVLTSPPRTWEWDGTSWTEVNPASAPSPRSDAAMAYDSVRRETLLFGGYIWSSSTPVHMSDLWAWNGTTWTQKAASGPAVRSKAAMAFDDHRGVAVLHGGWDTYLTASFYGYYSTIAATHLRDTWEWNGASWISKGDGPQRKGHVMAYEPQRRRMVFFGGSTSSITWGTTWEYDGSSWYGGPTGPAARSGYAGMTFDGRRGQLLLTGGHSSSATWAYSTPLPAAALPFGNGCTGTVGTPNLAATELPWLNCSLAVQVGSVPAGEVALLVLGTSTSTWGGVGLPSALGAVGMPGCTLYVSIDTLLPMSAAGGLATFSTPIPGVPSLGGATLHLQSFVTDAGANPLGVISANALSATLGVW